MHFATRGRRESEDQRARLVPSTGKGWKWTLGFIAGLESMAGLVELARLSN